MLDVIEQLEHYANAIAATVEPVRAADVGSIAIEPTTRPRRPRWQPLLAAAAAIALVAGGLWFFVNRSDSKPPASTSPISVTPSTGEPSTSTTPTTTPPAPPAGPNAAVETLDPGPLAARDGAAIAWTGSELVVWGGAIEPANRGLTGPDRQFADGAAYNPTTRTWRAMAAGPLPADQNTPIAVTTAGGVVIARGQSVARWDPEKNSWTRFDDSPAAVKDLTSINPRLVVSASADAALDPTTGRWQALPPIPIPLRRTVAALTDDGLVVVGERTDAAAGAIQLDPATRTWRLLPDPPNLHPAALSAGVDGSRAVFVDHDMNASAYGAGAWEALPPVPARVSDFTPQIAGVAPALVVSTAEAVAVETNGVWTPVAKGPLDFWGSGATAVPVETARGSSLFVFGLGADGEAVTGRNRLTWVDPVLLATTARTLQVGAMRLTIPDGMHLVHSDYVDKSSGQTVLVTLSTPTGNCDVTSTYDGGAGGEAHPWSAYASGLTWSARATSSDAVKVVCGTDPAAAMQIVDATSVPRSVPGQ